MKKTLIGAAIISSLILPSLVLATPLNPLQSPPPLTGAQLWNSFVGLIDWIFTIFLIVAVIFLIVAAFYFITAQGDPEKIIKSRKFVLYALIGIGIAVAARGLVALAGYIIGAIVTVP